MNDDINNVDQEIGIVTLIQGEMDGKPFWAYLSVRPSEFENYQKAQQDGEEICLTDYGDILRYGLDEKLPPASVQKEMEEQYPLIDHNFEEKTEDMVRRLLNGPQ